MLLGSALFSKCGDHPCASVDSQLSLDELLADNNICGVLKLHMTPIMLASDDGGKSRNKQALFRTYLLNPIYQQLSECPRSLIFIDEIQFVHRDLLNALKPLFDVSPQLVLDGKPPISTADAIFILASDLESSQQSQLAPHLTKVVVALASWLLASAG